jgi:hypothetical protein
MGTYERLRLGRGAPAGAVDAVGNARASLGRELTAAREQAGLTQAALAAKLGKSQTLVSGAESGRDPVSDRYVAAVLGACGPPAGRRPRAPQSAPRRHHARADSR